MATAEARVLEAPPALVLNGVTAGYRRNCPILRDLDLSVPCGACWAVLGPSGGGKTTLLRVLLGILRPEQGSVQRPVLAELNGAGRGAVGYIPQNLGLVRNVTVRENVLLGALNRIGRLRSLLGRFPLRELRGAEEALERVGLGGRGDDRIETLSGGERRRVAIARALLQKPRLLVADEFLAELDPITAAEIVALIQELRRTTDLTMIFVDHDVEAACKIADQVVVLVEGRKVCELAAETADPARIRDIFHCGLAV